MEVFKGSARSLVQTRFKTSYGINMMMSTIHNSSGLLAFAKVLGKGKEMRIA